MNVKDERNMYGNNSTLGRVLVCLPRGVMAHERQPLAATTVVRRAAADVR